MREYLFGLVLVGIAVSVALAVCHSATKGAVRIALGLLLVCTIVSPLLELIGSVNDIELPKLDFSGEMGEDGYTEVSAEAFERGVGEAIEDEFRVDGEVKAVCYGFDLRSVRAEEIYITLSEEATTLDYRAVSEFVVEHFTDEGRCKVEILAW